MLLDIKRNRENYIVTTIKVNETAQKKLKELNEKYGLKMQDVIDITFEFDLVEKFLEELENKFRKAFETVEKLEQKEEQKPEIKEETKEEQQEPKKQSRKRNKKANS